MSAPQSTGIRYPDMYARGMSSPDAMGAVASHVEREYGYGYRIGQLSSSLFCVRHSDGSTFVLRSDSYGNVSRLSRDQLEQAFGPEVDAS